MEENPRLLTKNADNHCEHPQNVKLIVETLVRVREIEEFIRNIELFVLWRQIDNEKVSSMNISNLFLFYLPFDHKNSKIQASDRGFGLTVFFRQVCWPSIEVSTIKWYVKLVISGHLYFCFCIAWKFRLNFVSQRSQFYSLVINRVQGHSNFWFWSPWNVSVSMNRHVINLCKVKCS